MIIFGQKYFEIDASQHPEIECFNCKEQGLSVLKRYIKTVHLYFLLIFPYGITDEVTCVGCGRSLEFREMNEANKARYQPGRSTKKPSLLYFSGYITIALLIGWGFYSSISKKLDHFSKINSLATGMVVDVELEDKTYTAIKIVKVEDNFVFYFENKYAVDRVEGIFQLHQPDHFNTDSLIMGQHVLEEWAREGKIVSIVGP